MASKQKHKTRSRVTYRKRMNAARWYLNYILTRAERLQRMKGG